jgi:hypothetical protein
MQTNFLLFWNDLTYKSKYVDLLKKCFIGPAPVEANPTNKFSSTFNHSFCKLDHLRATENNVSQYEMSYFTKSSQKIYSK